ncbi:hypothetical protein [Gemmobacter sp. LW-1]|uniref:hypothetical protein n=1 Tax=Gemmobacter sp. LW-1 TaxID=1529005 RepID=UPI0006C75194|nr:hypothetical protein [Gemmobacter sp. LW-1]
MIQGPASRTTFHVLQPAIWPEAGISTEIMPYMTPRGPCVSSLGRGGVTFAPGGTLSVDGYFNLFNLGKWRDCCGDIPLSLRLRGEGRLHVTVWLARHDKSWDRILSEPVTLLGEMTLPLDLSEAQAPQMVLFFEITALSDGKLEDFAWGTPLPPRQLPELMLSVTTFRREAEVADTVARFRRFRAASPLRDHLRMLVVDNGQSLALEPGDGVSFLPNANLGGAGGFSRGLLEARASGATHCLFMDDDASVHMEAITRTWTLLAYATDPRTAVAGAMINADHRWQIWENGAVFNGGCRPLFHGTDLRDREKVFRMEFDTTGPMPEGHYAGWWYFAFPVDQARHMPFPFFVRGDDVSFSLANDFRCVSLPGVASFQESFTDKAAPLTWYLDLRSHLAHHLSLPQKQASWGRMMRMVVNFYLRTVLRFHYDSLSAVNLAIEDVLRGPQFFDAHADMATRRQDLKAMTVTEAWQKLDPQKPVPTIRHGKLSRWQRALLLLTLNGHLLPLANRFGSDLVIEAAHRENHREIYGARQITYLNAARTSGYTVTRDRRRFWRESLRLARNCLALRRQLPQLRAEWQGTYAGLTSEEFWKAKLAVATGGT